MTRNQSSSRRQIRQLQRERARRIEQSKLNRPLGRLDLAARRDVVKPGTGHKLRENLAIAATKTLHERAKRWQSGGIPGGRRETRALSEYLSSKHWTPAEWQAHCARTTKSERRAELRGAP